jgi:hypothetical protein
MFKPKHLLWTLLVAAVSAVVGCASEQPAGEERQASETQTGSNIPRKNRSADKVQTLGPDSLQKPIPPPTRPPAGSGGS